MTRFEAITTVGGWGHPLQLPLRLSIVNHRPSVTTCSAGLPGLPVMA